MYQYEDLILKKTMERTRTAEQSNSSSPTSRLSNSHSTHHSSHNNLTNSSSEPYQHDHQPERLPTYNELKEQEGHRFGRWKGWIEKRARERMGERALDRQQAEAQGLPFKTSWDLPQHPSNTQSSPPSANINRNSSIISSRDEREAFKSASRNHRDAFLKHQKGRSEASHHPLALGSAPGAVNLTPSTSIHQIGSRFLPQFPSQPLCAIPLPLCRQPSSTESPVERFLLVGTLDGLYVCDLIPSLSSTVKKDLASPTDSIIYQLWQGLGIHQLEIAIEDPLHSSDPAASPSALPGIVIALTSSTDDSNGSLDGITKLIKMWPLQSIINLVKFRAFSQNSECLDLQEQPPSSRRDSAITVGVSALAGLKSMFEKGKHKSGSSTSGLAENFQHAFSSHPTSSSSRTPSSSFASHTQTIPSVDSSPSSSHHTASNLELPLQWAKQTISLNLPRIQANGPILFIKLSNFPTQGFNPINDQLDQMADSSAIPIGLRPRSYVGPGIDDLPTSAGAGGAQNDGWWYLIIATKQLIFVMESQPASQRTWHLCAEMSAPFTAKAANLVLSVFPKSNHPNRVSSSSRSLPTSRRPNHHRIGIGELAVLLTMKEYAVVISLSDLSVRELDLHGGVVASQTTSGLSTAGRTLKPTSGSFSGLDHLDRVQSNFNPFARTMPSIGGSGDPMGAGAARNDGFQVENRRSIVSVQDRRWVGCEELVIPVLSRTPAAGHRNPNPRVVYLITRGHLTHTVMCPIGYKARARSSQREPVSMAADQAGAIAGGLPPPLLLKPVHTFTWKAVPLKVHARIIPTPSRWAGRGGGWTSGSDTTDGSDGDEGRAEVFCCLTAFTASSIEVQEGFLSLAHLRRGWEGGRARGRFFTPASAHAAGRPASMCSARSGRSAAPAWIAGLASPGRPDDQDDQADMSSYDYNTKIGYLCSSASAFRPAPSPAPHSPALHRNPDSSDSAVSTATVRPPSAPASLGSFFWKEAVGEWKIMFVCNSMDR